MTKIRGFTYNAAAGGKLTVSGVSAENALAFLAQLHGMEPPVPGISIAMDLRDTDPDLADAIRADGTPASKLHRELEDVVADSGGEVAVTHAAGAEPVLVPKGDELQGLPAEAPVVAEPEPPKPAKPKKVAKKKAKKKAPPRPEELAEAPKEEPQVDPAAEAEERAAHAQRWAGKTSYTQGVGHATETIVGFVIEGDYGVVLEMASGERVYLDEEDREVGRKLPVAKLSDTESRAGDFKPGDPVPEEEVGVPLLAEPPPETGPPADIPPEAISATKLRELVEPFAKRRDGKGPTIARQILDECERAAQFNPHLRSHPNIRARCARVLMTIHEKITVDECTTMIAAMS